MDLVLLVIAMVCLHHNKQAISFTILIGFFTSYYLMGSNISNFIIPHNLSDTGILLYLYIIIYGRTQSTHYIYPILRHLFWPLHIFGLFLILAGLYDFAGGASIISILQCYRHWLLMLLSVILFQYYPVSVYRQTIKYILYISVFATVLILMDHYLGTQILHEDAGLFISKGGISYKRGAIPTTFCVLFILLLLTDYFREIQVKWRYLMSFLFLVSVTASMIRSMLFSVLLGIFLILYKTGKLKLSNVGTFVIGGILVMGIIFSDSGLKERILSGINEVNTLSLSSNSSDKEKGNMSFRMELAAERYDYVVSQWDRILFGIGSIHERNFPTTFKIGLYNSKMNRVTQLDTGDIAWAILFLRLGILGTILFVMFWLFLTNLFKHCNNSLGKTGRIYLLISFLISFCGTTVANGSFWFFIILLLIVASELEETEGEQKTLEMN